MIGTTETKSGRTSRWRLYILRCRDGSLYTGITNNLERRLVQHNKGVASRYTRSRLPVTLVYAELCQTKSSALKKELRIKTLSRKEKNDYIAAQRKRGARQRLGEHDGRQNY